MFDIAFSTIHREKQYLFETLKDFSKATTSSPRINLVVGNPEMAYLNGYQYNPLINIIPITEEEWALAKDKGKCDKFNLNFYRCLTQQVNPSLEGRLYLEDDITFKKDWDTTLSTMITELKKDVPEFALSLYSPYDLSKNEADLINFRSGFYGTQGVFFTKGIMQEFANKIMNEGILNYRHMADILLQEYCVEKNIPLFVVKNSLIQHTGVESSIHDNAFHKSVTYK